MEARPISHKKIFLQKSDLNTFLTLYELAKKNPKKGKKEVEGLYNKYPNHPEILNLLASIYLSLGKMGKANRLIEENYRKNPDYLFAKINFADLLLRQNASETIPDIFNQTFHLPAL